MYCTGVPVQREAISGNRRILFRRPPRGGAANTPSDTHARPRTLVSLREPTAGVGGVRELGPATPTLTLGTNATACSTAVKDNLLHLLQDPQSYLSYEKKMQRFHHLELDRRRDRALWCVVRCGGGGHLLLLARGG